MLYLRKSEDRGQVNMGWLSSRHSFSFGYYYDPKHMGFSVLRVLNDDHVAPGAGFDTHGHRDMEIITCVLQGRIEHKDSMGERSVIAAGEVQHMSAGTGVTHSEYNASTSEPLRFLQIWIQPNQRGTTPSYQQASIPQKSIMTPLVTADGRENSLVMQQDANLYRLQLTAGEQIQLSTALRPGYLHIIDGEITIAENQLSSGDAIGAFQQPLSLTAVTDVTALWFDLPPNKIVGY